MFLTMRRQIAAFGWALRLIPASQASLGHTKGAFDHDVPRIWRIETFRTSSVAILCAIAAVMRAEADRSRP
jgi:hypothetical protein